MLAPRHLCRVNNIALHHIYNTMYRYIQTLRDPQIVARIQNFFGVSYTEVEKLPKDGKYATKEETSAMLRKKSSVASPEVIEESKISSENDSVKVDVAEDGRESFQEESDRKNYVIRNKFWYYLFMFGTYLGDDVGYAILIPFWFWNVDSVVGRKLVLVWTVVMYAGQTLKDVICWPRPPCPPVIRLQQKWALEHGMPSTHAMVGVALPSTILYYSIPRYDFPVEYGIIAAGVWCTLISLSRLYLGMHSLLDVLAGLLLSSILLIPLLPIMDFIGNEIPEFYWLPVVIVTVSLVLVIVYPTGSKWTPTRGDTTTILAACVGVQIGFWLSYQLKLAHPIPEQTKYVVSWLGWQNFGILVLRTLIGYVGIIASFAVCDGVTKSVDCALHAARFQVRDASTQRRVLPLDLSYKFATYSFTAFNIAFTMPLMFQQLNIGRETFYLDG